MNEIELRLGKILSLYYQVKGDRLPRQLDLLEDWFPGLIITVEEDTEKKAARYDDQDRHIHAQRSRGSLYLGDSSRVSQICGRLVGTARSNGEKERLSGEDIQKRIARELVSEEAKMLALLENTKKKLAALSEEQCDLLQDLFLDGTEALAEQESDRREPYPLEEETYQQLVYNAAYQLALLSEEGLYRAFLWLLLGSLLREQCGRLLRIYDSSFIPVRQQRSEDPTLSSKVDYLLHPEEYYSIYDGDDLEKRFPGIAWYCDECGAYLNEQEGFDDRKEVWVCQKCGHENPISMEEIYENEEDWQSGKEPLDPEVYRQAIEAAKKRK